MKTMNIRALVSSKLFIGIVILAIAGGAAKIYFFNNGTSSFETLVVHSALFAQQIAVSGTVQAAQQVDLGFAQSGRVAHTYASVGQSVGAGTLLAEVDNGDLRAAVAQKQAALQAAQATLASLKTGTRSEQIAVTQAQISSDQSALAQANQAVVNAIQNAYTVSDDAVRNKADQFFNNPRSVSPQIVFTTSNTQLAALLVNDRIAIEALMNEWQKNAGALTPESDLSSAGANALGNLSQVTAFLSDANAALNAAVPSATASQTTIDGYITDVATARVNINAAVTTLTSAITAAAGDASALQKDQKSLALEQAGSTPEDIAAQEAQVAAAEADVESAQADLQKTQVVAPFDGIVTRMDAKVGEVVSPTTPQISMISNGLFQIQTYIPEVEITGIAVGNAATTTLDAYGPSTPFAAKVIAIDPAETVVNGVSTYKTTLQFLAKDPRIKSGMTASVLITTASVPNAIAVPLGAIFQKGGVQVVQVERGGSIVDVPARIGGNSSIGNVQVLSGLSDGDTVILNPDPNR